MDAPETFELDLNGLTIDEIEQIEDIIDAPFDEAFRPGAKRGKVLRAMAFVAKRRENPDITLEDVGKLRLSLGSNTVPPTDASA